MIFRYLKYLLIAKRRGYGIHSPFAYKLSIRMFKDKKKNNNYQKIENLRKKLLKNETEISVTDFGAGSKKMLSNKRKIKNIAKYSATPHKYGKLLTCLIQYFKPDSILEIGTSLGIGTLYLSAQNKNTKIFTLEGCPETAKIAKNNFSEINKDIKIVVGQFDENLEKILDKIKKLDFVFIDGNHRKKPTLKYFETVLKYCHNNTVIVFDDIMWTKQMQEAWQEIKKHNKTTQVINIFKMGIVFLKKELSKEEILIFY